MKRWRKILLWLVCGGGSLVLAAAAYFVWDDLQFAWKFDRLAHREGGYVPLAVRGEQPEDAVAIEDWFVDRGDFALPRLRSRLDSSERLEKLAALQLIWKIQDDRALKPDMEDFWRAFEDKEAVEMYLARPFTVILTGGASGIHIREETGVLLVHASPAEVVLWHVKAKPLTSDEEVEAEARRALRRRQGEAGPPGAEIRKTILKGSGCERLKLDLARALSLSPFGEFSKEHELERYSILRDPEGRSHEFFFTGWYWLDRLADHYATLAEGLAGKVTEPFQAGETLEFLLTAIEHSPSDVSGVHAALGLLELELSPGELETARSRLRVVDSKVRVYTVHDGLENCAVAAALHFLGDSTTLEAVVESRLWPFWLERVIAARPEGIYRPGAQVLDGHAAMRWRVTGLSLDIWPDDASTVWLMLELDRAGLEEKIELLTGAAQNRKACFHGLVMHVLRKVAPAVRATYLKKLHIEPPPEDTEEAWAKLLDDLEQKEKASR